MSKPETWKSWEGRVVEGKFPLRQWLGGSEHSAVFLTESANLPSQKIAIKFIPVESGKADSHLSHLALTKKLSHPHLIRTYECGSCRMDGSQLLYVLMECADDDLSQILPERSLEPREVSDLLPPVLDALSYLHRNGFVHGRVKPSNVLAVGDQLKLSSDQATAVSEPDGDHRRRDVYDAPETAAGIVSPAGDIWSVGVTLAAALTQNVTVAEAASPSDRDLPESVPEPFRGIVKDCLQLDPNRRGSVREIQSRLLSGDRYVPATAKPIAVPATTEPLEAAASPVDSKRRRPLVLAATFIVVVVGILLAVLFSRSNKTSDAPETSTAPTISNSGPASAAPANPAETTSKPQASAGGVVRQVLPDVPRSAQNTIRGTIKVVVRVQVDPSGKVASATFKMRGSSAYFAKEALNAAKRWEFSAPQIDGQATASTWLLQFRFKRNGIQATPQQVKG
jgi:TonB family protein